MFDVVGLGYTAVDYLAVVPHYPALDAKVRMLDFSRQGGGPVATAMVTVARLGAKPAYIGKLGDDDFGRLTLRFFETEGVDTSGVVIAPGSPSRFSFIIVDKDTGKRTIIWSDVQMPPLTAAEISREQILSGKILHLDGHEPDAALSAAKWANEAGVPVSMDAGTLRVGIEKLVDYVDILVTSEDFARNFTGESDPMAGARKMLDGRTGISGVTIGDRGSVFTDGKDEFHMPAFKVGVVDTTGAGDVFHGGFVYAVLQGWDLRTSARFASAVAALKCTKLGGRAGIPTLCEVQAFLEGQPKTHNP